MDGLAELKVKESDRLAATVAGLTANGVIARADGDTLIVHGAREVRGGGTVATHLDHRIAMAFLTMGLASRDAGDGRRHDHGGDELPRVRHADGRARRALRHAIGSRRDDHRHRRTGRIGQGHARQAHRRPSGGCRASTPGCSTAPSRATCAARGFRLDDRWAGARRGPRPRRLRASAIRACAPPQAGDAASIVARIPEVRAALLVYQRAFAAPARRRRARRPRHRHGRLPRRRRQDLRHRPHRGARQAPVSRSARPAARPSPSRRILADIVRRDDRDAGRGQRPHAARPRRRLARYHRTWI